MTGFVNFCLYVFLYAFYLFYYWDFAVKLKPELSNALGLDRNYNLIGKQTKSLCIDTAYAAALLHSLPGKIQRKRSTLR